MPQLVPRFGLPWTPGEAALAVSPNSDGELLAYLAERLGLTEVEPGRYDAADLLALHDAISPFLRRRVCTVKGTPAE